MKLRRLSIAVLTALLLVAQISDLLAKKKKKNRAPRAKLQGEYLYSETRETGILEAVFTPTGENRWKVKFFVTYSNQLGNYDGTAEGNLTEGTLSGTVRGDHVGHTFTFSGAVEDGIFRGTHQMVTAKKAEDTGTLIMYRKGRAAP